MFDRIKISGFQNKAFMYLLIVVVAYIFWFILNPYFLVLCVSAIVTVLTYPLYNYLRVRISEFFILLLSRFKLTVAKSFINNLSAILTIVITIFIIFVISNITIKLFFGDLRKIVRDTTSQLDSVLENKQIKNGIENSGVNPQRVRDALANSKQYLSQDGNLKIDSTNLEYIYSAEVTKEFSDIINQFGRLVLMQTFNILFNLIIFLISWFVLLVSGKSILKSFYGFTQFTLEEQKILNSDAASAMKNVIIGNFLSGLLNAIGVYLIVTIFGLPYSVLVVIIAFFIGFLPLSPSELAYLIPVAMLYIVNPGAALIVAFCAEVYILFLNYVVVPKIIASTHVNPLMILLGTFSLINIFGLLGFILGPIAVYIASSLLKIIKNRSLMHNE